MQTRKYPRTLNEAFGPYTSQDFIENDPMPMADKIAIFASACAAVAFIGIALLRWL